MLPNATNAAVACTEIRTPIGSPNLKEAVWFISEHWAALSRSLSSLSTFAFAQGTADIVGRVTDTSGAVLPAVTVTAENIATKNVRTHRHQRHRRLRVHPPADRHLYRQDRAAGLPDGQLPRRACDRRPRAR